jgi:hypothetical protein
MIVEAEVQPAATPRAAARGERMRSRKGRFVTVGIGLSGSGSGSLQKRRNEKAVKGLKTHDPEKSLIRRC